MDVWDVIIVGGGSAGFTAAVYAARRKMKTLIIAKNVGGQALEASKIENYPGFLSVSGAKLMLKFQNQTIKAGAEIMSGEVSNLNERNGIFFVKTDEGEYKSKAVILAFGKTPRTLDAIGEKEFRGKGVSYCATCDMPLFENKTIAVVGGGNSALDAALYGSKVASKVYLIHRRNEFRCFECFTDEVKKKSNVELVLSSVIKEIKGNNTINSILIENVETKKTKELKVQGVFVEVGSEVKTDFLKNVVKLDENGHIVVNNRCETFHPSSDKIRSGIFAAGDITSIPFKQVVVAAGEGAKAALQAWSYLNEGKPLYTR